MITKISEELILPEVCIWYKGLLFKDLDALLSTERHGVYPDEISLVRLMYVNEKGKSFLPTVVELPQQKDIYYDK